MVLFYSNRIHFSFNVTFPFNFVALGCSCPTEELDLVGNATLTCFNEDSCEARCYDDYIFPTGYATIKYSCQDGQWTPNITSCKGTI